MKITLLNDSYAPTIDGVANVVKNYAENLHNDGFGVQVVTPSHPEADDSASPWDVLRYPSIDMRRKIGYVAGMPFSPETLKRVRGFEPELLHTHCPIASALLALSLQKEVNAPLVLTYHTRYDIDFAKALKNKYLTKLAVSTLVSIINACDEVWTVSRGAGESLREIGYTGSYTVMPNGVDIPRTRMSGEEIRCLTGETDGGGPLFLFVGRLMWYKGIRIILDALSKLRDAGFAFRMAFVGSGKDEAEIRTYAEEQGLADRVRFLGMLSDRRTLCAWYCRADVMLFPSTFDTNGLVVREAAACGLPAVLVRGSCAAEGVEDGVNGFLIDENAESLCETLKKLCGEPEKMRQVGENASRDLYFSWQDAVRRAEERYPAIIENYKSGLYAGKKRGDELFKINGELMELTEKIKEFKITRK